MASHCLQNCCPRAAHAQCPASALRIYRRFPRGRHHDYQNRHSLKTHGGARRSGGAGAFQPGRQACRRPLCPSPADRRRDGARRGAGSGSGARRVYGGGTWRGWASPRSARRSSSSPDWTWRPREARAPQTTLSLRGSTSGQVLVIVDGVRISDPATGQCDLSRLGFDLADIESIEVIRGGASAPVRRRRPWAAWSSSRRRRAAVEGTSRA